MLLSWLSKLVASLLVSVLCAVVVTTVLDQTVLNSHYLEGHLTATNSYDKLSVALSDQVTKSVGTADPAVATKVQTILTPEVLKTKINSTLDQLQAYYKSKNSPPPILDLSDLAAQAQTAGIPLGDSTDLTKPIKLGGTNSTNNSGSTYQLVRLTTVTAAVILTLLLVLICWKRRSYVALTGVLIGVGITIGLVAAILYLSPGLLNHFIKSSLDANAFAGIAKGLATNIAHDLGKRFGLIAALFLIAGIGSRIWLIRLSTLKLKAPPAFVPPRSTLSR